MGEPSLGGGISTVGHLFVGETPAAARDTFYPTRSSASTSSSASTGSWARSIWAVSRDIT